LVSDNRSLSSVEFFIEKNGVSIFSKPFTSTDINSIVGEGDFFSASLRAPQNPDSGSVNIGVRAQDNLGLVTEELLDIIILDDEEAPVINFVNPDTDLSLNAGDAFSVNGTASDNVYIDKITPYLILGDKEIELGWEILARDDRLDQIRVANSASFGSVVAAERFATDYEGRVRIPVNLVNRAGDTFEFVLRATDKGINIADSNTIKLTIREDDEAPVITINTPGTELVEEQPVNLSVSIVDNISISSYSVTIVDAGVDGESQQILSQDNVNEADITINDSELIDLSVYSPVPDEGITINLIVRATDTVGNEATQNQQITLLPDHPIKHL